MRFSRTSKALGLAAVVAMSLSACGGGTDSGNTATGDTTKVITANSTEPENGLLPANTNEVGGGKVMDLIFTGLVSYDVTGRVVNELAESIETNGFPELHHQGQVPARRSAMAPRSRRRTSLTPGTSVQPPRTQQLNSYFFESIKGYDKVSAEGVHR